MKKTVNVNIASQPFTLDEEAYLALENYLDDIASRLPVSDTGSMDNIESRIARLFAARVQAGRQIISLGEVDEAKDIVGLPESFGRRTAASHTDAEQIVEEVDGVFECLSAGSAERPIPEERNPKPNAAVIVGRNPQTAAGQPDTALQTAAEPVKEPYDYPTHLYRSRDERMLAGVCGGLSKYLNYPVTTVRAVTAILALPALLSVFAYFILWYLLPEEPLYDKNGNVIDTGHSK
ncbi:MAG: PspC domain-containing protein [Alistipes sp.]|nr:PspC domain-containing protein [Alistipes sp.]